jgi:hypothetical protein
MLRRPPRAAVCFSGIGNPGLDGSTDHHRISLRHHPARQMEKLFARMREKKKIL